MLSRVSFYDLRFEDSIAIAAPVESGYAFFENMAANYTRWHPDHESFRWMGAGGLAVGNEFSFREKIAGRTQQKVVRITEVQPDRYFAFQPTNPIFRFFLPRLSFGFEPTPAGFSFRAIIDLHAIGPLGMRLNRREFDAVEQHMREEGLNLKRLLEEPIRTQTGNSSI
jgi:hypothetical protein